MSVFSRVFASFILSATCVVAADNHGIESARARQDTVPQTDPSSAFWQHARPVYAETDPHGKPVLDHRMEVRSRWTKGNIYFLFICPYEELYLKPAPDTVHETNQLWNWDVAEVFIGSDFKNIKHYKEFEVSPQGEWVDLDINLDRPHHEDGWVWNSGFQVAARIDRAAKVWYGTMRIPFAALDDRSPAPGNSFRVNFFTSQGPPPIRKGITWQPPMSNTFHVPERFGILKLVDAKLVDAKALKR
jgi:Carbohydrate family 9 binding domain-like